VEIPNGDEQENRDDALNERDSGNDYLYEDDKEPIVAE
jgi:hypothetical protein